MLKNALLLLLAAGSCLGATACKKQQTAAQVNAENEKKWRATQAQKATKYYDELVQKYPDSPYAEKARAKVEQTKTAKK